MQLRIETPRVFLPLLNPARYKGAHGGRGSGKSWFLAELLVERFLLDPTARAVCIREVQHTLAQSVKQLIEDRAKALGVESAFRILNTHIETSQGGFVLFQGMNNVTADNVKSMEGIDIAWFEEAQTCSQRSLDLLRPTIRKPGSELWFSWNPRRASDPVDMLLRGEARPTDSVVVRSTYLDNPWFPDVLKAEVELDKARDKDKYAHIWLGEYEQHSESLVFRNVVVEDFDTPSNASFYFGADWGYSIDPTVLIRCWIVGRRLYVDEEVYQIGCEIDHIPALFDRVEMGQARRWPITADSARPETISYLQRHGYPHMRAAKKGQGSVEDGIAFLQSYDIVIHPRCKHAIREFQTYSYKRDRFTKEVIPVLEDADNHVIDAVRYALENVRANSDVVAAIYPKW